MTCVVARPGLGTTVQDQGRPGRGHFGVSASGAFDRDALRQVNALLGNAPGAAALETYGGLDLVARAPHVVAVTGGVGPVSLDGRTVPYGRAVPVAPGQVLTVAAAAVGLRVYLGVAGGIAGRAELGSMSSDTLSGLGPAPLMAGDVLATGAARPVPALDDVPPLMRTGTLDLDIVLGPRDDWFTPEAVRLLLDEEWSVSTASNRVGVGLVGPHLDRAVTGELPSEPTLRGSIQVAADGRPVIFGPDHPVTGGYPVVAVVVDAHTDRLAQARPGQLVRFNRRS